MYIIRESWILSKIVAASKSTSFFTSLMFISSLSQSSMFKCPVGIGSINLYIQILVSIFIKIITVQFISIKVFPFSLFRILFSKRLLSGSHSSQSNLSQASVTSDPLATDDVEGCVSSQHARISERRSNSSSDIHGAGDISYVHAHASHRWYLDK